MKKSDRYAHFIDYFNTSQPNPKTELDYTTHYQLILAVVLSAQCTDKRVNEVTPALFKRFPTPDDMAVAAQDEVFEYIKSISYPNSKAGYLIGLSKVLLSDFSGKVPQEPYQLITLPGVGRKTANVVASVLFNKPVMPVDTHVFRVANRIGLTTAAKTPLESELELTKYFPKRHIANAHHWLILHGRYICKARKAQCDKCKITFFCNYYKKKKKK